MVFGYKISKKAHKLFFDNRQNVSPLCRTLHRRSHHPYHHSRNIYEQCIIFYKHRKNFYKHCRKSRKHCRFSPFAGTNQQARFVDFCLLFI